MVPPNNLGPDLSGKAVNETQYRGMIRLLMYLTARRHDIQFSTCLCARYQANPKESHIITVKRIFSAKKQQSVAMSLAEAEYIVAAGCCANILWMKSQLTNYDIIYEKLPIFCDNTSAIAILNNPVLHSRTKHIDIRYHFIRDHILKGDIELHFILTQYQLADIFTKPLDELTFKRLIVELGYNGEIEAKGTLKKSCLPPRWRLLMGQIIQCLGGKTGGLDQISNKDATILYYLANGVQVDYAKLIWEDLIHKLNKKTMEKFVPYPRFISLLLEHMMLEYDNKELTINHTQVFSVHNWTLKPNQLEEPPFTTHMKAICKLDVHVVSKAQKPTSETEEVPQGKKPRAKTKDKSPSHPSPPTLVVAEMHKEAQQEVGGPTSLGATSVEGNHPQLSSGHDASTDSTAKADPGSSAPNDSISSKQDMDKGTKNYSFDHIFAGSNLSVLVDKTKFVGDGLKTTHTDSGTNEKSRADDVTFLNF
ncbi:hypothetical protein Tco_1235670, partial [Tanacetum coccineum]